MKILYIECNMGCAGNMLAAALLELMPDPDKALGELNGIGLPGVLYECRKVSSCGITGSYISVKIHGEEEGEHCHEHEHHHRHHGMDDIRAIVGALSVSERVKGQVMAVYALLAEAESHVHGRPVEEIHFHEVGAMDAVADVTAVCFLLEKLGADRICASSVHVGSGTVKCAHGVLPVPAPATAYILRGVPCYSGSIRTELCTPTGAALLRYFVSEYGEMPVMRVGSIGYGMGKKELSAVNAVRVMLGECESPTEQIVMLSFNVDDMTAEQIAFAAERMFDAGAAEVFTVPIGMKKSRPGTLICALCPPEGRDALLRAAFLNTSTLGIRENICRRHVLERETVCCDTPYGTVRIKRAEGYGVKREKTEYEDLARIARGNGISFAEAGAAAACYTEREK